MIKYYFGVICGLLLYNNSYCQTLVTSPLNQLNTTGHYYSPTSIILAPGFSTAPGGTFSASITQAACANLNALPSQDQNYISIYTPRVAFGSETDLKTKNICEVAQTIQYIDGLGRPLQTVHLKASPYATDDLVQPFAYDLFGREVKKYLPYTEAGSNNGSYKADALSVGAGVQLFYNPAGTNEQLSNGSPRNTKPFAETRFEGSMLGRPVEQGAQGEDWQLSQGHTIKTTYLTNSTPYDVIRYSPTFVGGSNYKMNIGYGVAYEINTLTKIVVKDENWQSSDGLAGTTEEFTDKAGRIVLKRNYNKTPVGVIQPLSTYYVYDDYGNLVFVLPPYTYGNGETLPPGTFQQPTQQQLDEIAYQYRYDGKNRLIEKKLPGKGWEYMVYNKLNQLVMTQDANQRAHANQDWLVVKYDKFGRVAVTGIFKDAGSTANADRRAAIQTSAEASSTKPYWEERTVNTGDGYKNAYNDGFYNNYPFSLNVTLTVSYYDSYNFPGAATLPATGTASTYIKGLPTGLLIYTTSGMQSYLSVTYYNDEGLIKEVVAQNNVGGIDRLANTYDFSGALVTSIRTHTKPSQADITIAMSYDYDHMGRKIQTKQSINNATPIILSKLTYNKIGQLRSKQLHSSNNGTSFLNNTIYTYNQRGWISGINNPNDISADIFGIQLQYNSGATPQYNGNISALSWQTKVPAGLNLYQAKQSYSYTYDKLNRLTNAVYTTPGAENKFNETLDYDERGNIKTLKRTNTTSAGIFLNNLAYNYTGSGITGNKLYSVDDAGTANQNGAYTYDTNGNTITDTRSQVTNIAYNYLNLPDVVSRTPGNISYTYTAGGTKLKKATSAITRDYAGGIEYNNGSIEFIQTEEGRAIPNGNTYIYQYYLKDHLGNTRAAISQTGNIVQVQDYYAFGLDMNPGNAYIGSSANNYKYNGKEKQETGQYDYGARFYDPVIARWNSIDPLAEAFDEVTPYNYGMNNPILMVDPTGMSADTLIGPNGIGPKDTIIEPLQNGIPVYSAATVTPKASGNADGNSSGATGTGNGSDEGSGIGGSSTGQNLAPASLAMFSIPETIISNAGLDNLQSSLDAGGIGDPTGIVDGINALIYTGRGQWKNAAISAISILPFGDIAKAGKIGAKLIKGRKVEQYTLRAAQDGFYPVMKRGFANAQELVWLDKGDIWKIGTTRNPFKRYTNRFLRTTAEGLKYEKEFVGTLNEALILERMKILNYIEQTGFLPAGNKIIR